MNYFKILLSVLALFICSNIAFADFNYRDWEDVSNGEKTIYLDTSSIREENGSLFYNVQYIINGKSAIVVIQSKGNMAGIVTTYDDYYHSPYHYDYKPTQPSPKTATKFNPITESSLLYNANLRANMLNNRLKSMQKNNTPKVQEIDWSPYFELLNMRFRSNWKKPKGSKSKQATVSVRIYKTGELVSCNIVQSSGDTEFDNSVIKAVYDTGYLVKLPYDYEKDYVDLQFTFK